MKGEWFSPRVRRHDVVARIVLGVLQALERAQQADTLGAQAGFLQSLDPRIKLLSAFALIISSILTHHLLVLLALFVLAGLLACASSIPLRLLARRLWLGILLFTGLVALPSIALVPGELLWRVPVLGWSLSWQGLRAAAFLLGRAETAATFALLLMLSTPWPHLLKALRALHLPVVLLAILGMTHRYIFVLAQTAQQLFEARKSRIVGAMSAAQQRQLACSSVGVLLGKAFYLSTEVHLAMLSRGYRGEVRLLHEFRTRRRDWWVLGAALSVPLALSWGAR